MLEVLNKLPIRRFDGVDNFLAFIGIYEDKRRSALLRRLLFNNRKLISGKVGVEAGAGLGDITEFLLTLGVKKVFAVEQNSCCVRFLKERFKAKKKVNVIQEKIEHFIPQGKKGVDFVFQELYGPLLFDESLLALERIKFDPGTVLPNGGVIYAEAARLKDSHDPVVDADIFRQLEGALITDLFPNYKFRKPFVVCEWKFKRGRRVYSFSKKIKGNGDILVLGMGIAHNNSKVAGTADCFNWPYVFTPVKGNEFRLRFSYDRGITETTFDWIR